ncbi:MAG: AsmA-like C-terminal domain-containing protein [Deltaproteobacteria bacterium]|nr:MAG: AsmA-like C-terminal domain-containing protein [Deltaproteobacteria bacterium]
MSKQKKIFLWLITGFVSFLILLTALILFSNLIINQEEILGRIQSAASGEIPGEIEFQRIGLSFLFRPHVVIHQGKFNIPGKATGRLESLAVYPALLPLLTGKVRVSKLIVEAPNIQIKLPASIEKKDKGAASIPLKDIQVQVVSALGSLAHIEPGLVVHIKSGRLKLFEGNRSAFWFKDIRANIKLPKEKFIFNLNCESSIWESISLDGWLDPSNLKSSGHLHLKNIRPQLLSEYFFPRGPLRVMETRADLNLHFSTDGPKQLQAAVNGTLPHLNLFNGKEKLVIKVKDIRGGIQIDNETTTVSLTRCNLDYPQLNMSGKLVLTQNEPMIDLQVEGRQVDVASTRRVALVLAGFIPTVQKIFERIKGGRVPLVTFSSRGQSWPDLDDTENMIIKGSMVDGNIFLPEAGMDLEAIQGDALISQGVLAGENLVARYGNSWGRDGTLKVGLEGKNAPLQLNISVTADVAQIPPVLKRLVKNRPFQNELKRVNNLSGNATGRLLLGETTALRKVQIDVSEFQLAANYARIPYPLQINGGRFSYTDSQVHVENLNGKLGRSSFTNLSAGMIWEKAPELAVKSLTSEIFLEEIFPWLTSFDSFPDQAGNIKTTDGIFKISALRMKGPPLKPENWELAATGEIKNAAVSTTLLPVPVRVLRGKFTEIQNAREQKFSFSDAQVSLLDGSFIVSGDLPDYLKGLNKAEVMIRGNMGPQAIRWASQLTLLPAELHPRSPLSISGARLIWEKNNKISFAGALSAANGPEVSLDVVKNPDRLNIKKLLIHDEESHASIRLDFKNRECRLHFTGHLAQTTVNNLLKETHFDNGWIKGDFHTRIAIDQPMRSTAQGKFQGQRIVLPSKLNLPLQINNISLQAAQNNIMVESAALTWDGIPMTLEGKVNFSEKKFLVDADLSTSSMNWDHVKKILETVDRNKGRKPSEKLWDMPMQGTIRVKSENFSYHQFTWSPVHAEISFNRDEININVNEARLCSISTPGALKISSQNLQLDFKPGSHNQALNSTLTCLSKDNHQIEGRFELGGYITGQGTPDELINALRGKFKFVAKDGRIYRSLVLARILAFLNVTEVFTGDLADLEKKGFGYKKIKFKTKIKKGQLRFKEILMDGNTLTITGGGNIDLNDGELDFTLLVSPLKTLDRIVDRVPLVGNILADVISIPLKVKGDLKDPKVVPLAPSAISTDLLDLTKRTLKLPFKIIQPAIPENSKKEN